MQTKATSSAGPKLQLRVRLEDKEKMRNHKQTRHRFNFYSRSLAGSVLTAAFPGRVLMKKTCLILNCKTVLNDDLIERMINIII